MEIDSSHAFTSERQNRKAERRIDHFELRHVGEMVGLQFAVKRKGPAAKPSNNRTVRARKRMRFERHQRDRFGLREQGAYRHRVGGSDRRGASGKSARD